MILFLVFAFFLHPSHMLFRAMAKLIEHKKYNMRDYFGTTPAFNNNKKKTNILCCVLQVRVGNILIQDMHLYINHSQPRMDAGCTSAIAAVVFLYIKSFFCWLYCCGVCVRRPQRRTCAKSCNTTWFLFLFHREDKFLI